MSGPLLVVQLLETPLLCLVSYARWAAGRWQGAWVWDGPPALGLRAGLWQQDWLPRVPGLASHPHCVGCKEGLGEGGVPRLEVPGPR